MLVSIFSGHASAISLVNPCHLILFYKENKNGLWAKLILKSQKVQFHPTTWIGFLAKIKPSSLMDWAYGPHSSLHIIGSHNTFFSTPWTGLMVCIRSTIRNRLAAHTSHASYNFSMDQDLQPILFLSSPT